MTPKLSIMIPTYNYGKYLKDAIDSVLSQKFTDIELIIVDNASIDDSEIIVKSFKSEKIKYYKNDKNIGSAKNFNKCMKLSSGKYLRYLCADDVLLPGILEKQVEILDSHPTVGLVTCDMYFTDERLENRSRANFYPGLESGERVIRSCCMNFGNRIGGPSNVMFRREAARGLEFEEKLRWVGDLKFYCKILKNWDYFNLDEVGYLYRRHSESDTESIKNVKIKNKEEIEFCLEMVGFKLIHLKYLKKKTYFFQKVKLLKNLFLSGKLNKLAELVKCVLRGKNIHGVLLSDYENVSISSNISYSNKNGLITISENSVVNDYTVIIIDNGPGAEFETSSLLIGKNTYVGELNNIRASGGVIKIGNNVLISQMVTIVASNHSMKITDTIVSQPWKRSAVLIEDDVWIGAGSVILPGAHIGKGSVIAANSVVKGVVAPYSVMAGAPAKKVKERC